MEREENEACDQEYLRSEREIGLVINSTVLSLSYHARYILFRRTEITLRVTRCE